MSDYVELHCHSNFSLLDGASHPEDLVTRAAEMGMPALAIADHDGLYGAVPFFFSALYLVLPVSVAGEVDESNLKKRRKDAALNLTSLW
jgi:error-prone DNA polymerase